MEFKIRQNLETHKYYLCVKTDIDYFDLWQFNHLPIANEVKKLLEEDTKPGLKEIQINVWDLLDEDSILCILTNDSVYGDSGPSPNYNDFYNPMDGGIAWECLQRNPGINNIVAKSILNDNRILGLDKQSKAMLFRFSTKHCIGDIKSDINLIEESLKELEIFVKAYYNKKVYLPRPGCGIGGLDWETEVKPLVEKYLGKYKNVYIVSK